MDDVLHCKFFRGCTPAQYSAEFRVIENRYCIESVTLGDVPEIKFDFLPITTKLWDLYDMVEAQDGVTSALVFLSFLANVQIVVKAATVIPGTWTAQNPTSTVLMFLLAKPEGAVSKELLASCAAEAKSMINVIISFMKRISTWEIALSSRVLIGQLRQALDTEIFMVDALCFGDSNLLATF